eukprot:TRINITY_DN5601_c0_g1_i1.p1 TRINITY_DN5601_c0_g1~~TRINITY_DN5601_c0_g1_i1.p1  ORF type:complete len:154 (-),score=53.97 TRINITY_DN5601_c0_g1_i1:80-541(-)
MIRRPPRSTQSRSSAASDVYKRQSLHICLQVVHRKNNVAGSSEDRICTSVKYAPMFPHSSHGTLAWSRHFQASSSPSTSSTCFCSCTMVRVIRCRTSCTYAHVGQQNRSCGPIVSHCKRLAQSGPVSYTHLRAHETVLDLVCRLLLEKKKNQQ